MQAEKVQPVVIDLDSATHQIPRTVGKPQQHFFLVGAGISCPEIPSAREMINDFKSIRNMDPPHFLTEPSPMEEYTQWFSTVHQGRETRRQYLQNKIVGARISYANLRLAQFLLAQNILRLVVTTNFDDLLSRALSMLGMHHFTYENSAAIQNFDWSRPEIQIVHIHGTYRDYDLKNLKVDFTIPNKTVNTLSNLLCHKSPLVIGYSGWEGDFFMTALKNNINSLGLPYPLYWFCYEPFDSTQFPDWLLKSHDVIFVAPHADHKQPAVNVINAIAESLELDLPSLGADPLGFYRKYLSNMLSDEILDEDDKELYKFMRRIIGAYPNRKHFSREYSPVRILAMAKHGSEILVTGRTLRTWLHTYVQEILYLAGEKDLKIKLLLSSDKACVSLDDTQKEEIAVDRKKVLRTLEHLHLKYPKLPFEIKETDSLIMDGITFAEMESAEDEDGDGYKLMALFDINAASGADKPAIVFACTCEGGVKDIDLPCTVHGLVVRMKNLFTRYASPLVLSTTTQEMSFIEKINNILEDHAHGLPTRNNQPKKYISALPSVFQAASDFQSTDSSIPLCVQINISSGCNTMCRMCDHWKSAEEEGSLSTDEWKKVIGNLADFGIRSIVFSGGEPLKYPELDEILAFTKSNNLHIGILTSGLIVSNRRDKVIRAIREKVDWVTVSIDGTEEIDRNIRDSQTSPRYRMLKRFCADISQSVKLSATVTLQKDNIIADPKRIASYIREFGITQTNFKFATGSIHALQTMPCFLIESNTLRDFFHSMCVSSFAQEEDNNLDYLRRSIAEGSFSINDISEGHPVLSFYTDRQTRCFTPYIFSLIDSLGVVYPCCHLYRDNHTTDDKSISFRNNFSMGNLKNTNYNFKRIWAGEKYNKFRSDVNIINPKKSNYSPCGECTRFFRHNHVLSELYKLFELNPEQFTSWARAQSQKEVVWF